MKKESREFLEKYLNNASPTGNETRGQEIWLEYITPYIDNYITDIYGTVAGALNPDKDYKVVIEAHADEISWVVNYITEDGYIYVIRNGGMDHQIAPSKRVNIHTKKGIVKAVIGWPSIGVREKDNNQPSLKNIVLDCGCKTRKETESLGVNIGCKVTYTEELMMLNNTYFTGRALDNRIGGFIIAEVLRMLKEKKAKLNYALYAVNAVQEEIGLKGAEMISRRLKPDVAIITDATHDTQSPHYDKKFTGDISCGKGPVITSSPPVQNNLREMLINTARKKKIPFQLKATPFFTNTDTEAFAYSNEGVASALISFPLKYMHTTVECVHKDDIENSIKLIYEFLISLKSGYDFRYIK
ncbi:MAG: putative aminopeptidase YsdC [Ignavibacteria bacterium]|nr:putative aminopeptidase YsdC [Ignavibacteria bacterium]